MIFEWDEAKSQRNKLKHGLSFEAVHDFDWETSIRIDRSREKDGEIRFASVGFYRGKLHSIIFVKRGDNLRIISMRRANRPEEQTYEDIQNEKAATRH